MKTVSVEFLSSIALTVRPMFLVALLVASLGFAQASAQDAPDAAQVVCPDALATRDSVLFVQGRLGGAGAAVVFGDRSHAITALHVVSGTQAPRATTRDGVEHDFEVVAVDAERDLALLEFATPVDALPVEPFTGTVRVSQRVIAVGHPNGREDALRAWSHQGLLRWSASFGRVTAVSTRWIQFDAAAHPGNSGGPLANCEGQLLGVASHQYSPVMSYATHVRHAVALWEGPKALVHPNLLGLAAHAFVGAGISHSGGRVLPSIGVEMGTFFFRGWIGPSVRLAVAGTLGGDVGATRSLELSLGGDLVLNLAFPRYQFRLLPRVGLTYLRRADTTLQVEGDRIVTDRLEENSLLASVGFTASWRMASLSYTLSLGEQVTQLVFAGIKF